MKMALVEMYVKLKQALFETTVPIMHCIWYTRNVVLHLAVSTGLASEFRILD